MAATVPGLGLGERPAEGSPWPLLLAGIGLGFAACLLFGAWTVPFHPRDNQHYFFISESFSRGIPPHVSAFDPKNMLAQMVVGMVIWLGDLLGVPVIVSARFASMLIFGGMIGVSALVSWRLTGRRLAGWLALPPCLTWTAMIYQAAVGGQPKIMLALLVGLCLLAVTYDRLVLAAFFSALAYLTWQPALMLTALVGVMALLRADRWALAWRMALAALVPVLVYQGYFWATGALQEQIEQAYRFPATYMTHGFNGVEIGFESTVRFWRKGFGLKNILPEVALLLVLLMVVGLIRRREANLAWAKRQPGWTFFLLTGAAIAGFTFYDKQGAPDLFFNLVHVTVLVACAALVALERTPGGIRRQAVGAAIAAIFLFVTVNAYYRVRPRYPFTLAQQVAAAGEVGAMAKRGETIFGANAGHLLAIARLENWTRHSSFFRGMNRYLPVLTGDSTAYQPLRDGELPTVILIGDADPYGWPTWLPAHYDNVTTPAFDSITVQVWRRKADPDATSSEGAGPR